MNTVIKRCILVLCKVDRNGKLCSVKNIKQFTSTQRRALCRTAGALGDGARWPSDSVESGRDSPPDRRRSLLPPLATSSSAMTRRTVVVVVAEGEEAVEKTGTSGGLSSTWGTQRRSSDGDDGSDGTPASAACRRRTCSRRRPPSTDQSAASTAPVRRSRTCTRTACRVLSSWCSCRSSNAERGSSCRNSCSACSCVHPSVEQPRLDQSSWTHPTCLPTWYTTRCCSPTTIPGETATAGSDRCLSK